MTDKKLQLLQLLQQQREDRAIDRAQWRRAAEARKAVEKGWQSRTRYGRQLFQQAAAYCAAAIDRRLSWYLLVPSRAGYHAAALPVLVKLFDPKRITAICLPVLIDRITEPISWEDMAAKLGRALEVEIALRAMRKQIGPSWVDELLRSDRSRLLGMDKRLLQRFGAAGYCWTRAEQFEVGALVLDCVAEKSQLLKISVRPDGQKMLAPTSLALEIIARCPPSELNPSYPPMVCPPRRWTGLVAGGLMETDEELIRPSRTARGLPYRTAMGHLWGIDLSLVYQGVNALQAVTLRVDPDMARTQWETWQAGMKRGLWAAGPAPAAFPTKPRGATEEVVKEWKIQYRRCLEVERKEKGRRLRISQALTAAVEVAGRPIWQAQFLDHRGRCYARNKLCTHQGPDNEKALLEFANGEPIKEADARWMLIAAANHHGCGRVTWAERIDYGSSLREDMRAIAAAPIDNAGLWRDAADPWQFLQVALAWSAWEIDRSAPVYCPIRMDQTTSGPGILAVLLRDQRLATLCNMAGTEPADLYLVVLDRVRREVERLAFQGDQHQQRHAATLAPLVGRAQMKTAVMSAPYGASLLGLQRNLMEWLIQEQGRGRQEFRERVMAPARFLAPIIYNEAKAVMGPSMELRLWLNQLGTTVLKTGKPVQWTTPAGLLVSCGERARKWRSIKTEIHGKWFVASLAEVDPKAPLSANETRRALVANVIHSLDGALVTRIAAKAGAAGVPLLANHDCFATLPSRAGWLHQQLRAETRAIYQEDQLGRIVTEIAARAQVPVPPGLPVVGDLDPATIGINSYLYG